MFKPTKKKWRMGGREIKDILQPCHILRKNQRSLLLLKKPEKRRQPGRPKHIVEEAADREEFGVLVSEVKPQLEHQWPW